MNISDRDEPRSFAHRPLTCLPASSSFLLASLLPLFVVLSWIRLNTMEGSDDGRLTKNHRSDERSAVIIAITIRLNKGSRRLLWK